jgi:hypothetical protein
VTFIPSPESIQDPRVARHALRELRRARDRADEGTARQLEGLFDAATVEHFLVSDDERVAMDLVRMLGADRLQPLADLLSERWYEAGPGLAHAISVRLAELTPDSFLQVVVEELDGGASRAELCGVPGLLDGLASLGPAAGPVAERLLADIDPASLAPASLRPVVGLCASLVPDRTAALLAGILRLRSVDPAHVHDALEDAFGSVSDGQRLHELFALHEEGEADQRLAEVPALFEPGAPLADLDRTARARRGKRFKGALRLLRETGPRGPAATLALAVLAELGKPKLGKEPREQLATFCLACVASAHSRDALALQAVPTPGLVRLIGVDLASAAVKQQLLDEAASRPADAIAAEVLGDLRQRPTSADVHGLLDLSIQRPSPAHVEPLVDLLVRDPEDATSDLVVRALAHHGRAAEQAILDRWHRLDGPQQVLAGDALARVGGDRTVEHLLAIFPDARSRTEPLETWCTVAAAVPDTRLVQVLLPELRRSHPVIDRCVLQSCALLGLEPDGLDRVRERCEALDLRAAEHMRAIYGTDGGRSLPETLWLDLACRGCGEENRFEVREVYASADTGHGELFVGDDHTCPTCGFRGVFRPTALSSIAVLTFLLQDLAGALRGSSPGGPVRIVERFEQDGRAVSPYDAVEAYEQRLAREPDHMESLLGLGNLYRNMGPPRLALDCYRRCVALDATCVEAAHTLAGMEEEAGHHREALALLERAWQLRDSWRFWRLRTMTPARFRTVFVHSHNALARRLGRPEIATGTTEAAPLAGDEVVAAAAGGRKIARNEPCPCGSGKKYKRCCLRR